MENFMNVAMVIEVAVFSVLAALWITWLGLSGLFKLMPVTAPAVKPIRFVADQEQQNCRSTAV
jgi:hypothetical protein